MNPPGGGLARVCFVVGRFGYVLSASIMQATIRPASQVASKLGIWDPRPSGIAE